MGSWTRLGGLGLLAFFIGQVPALAFDLGDHGRITRLAFADVVRCLPETSDLFSGFQQDLVVGGDLAEDLDLVRKWTRYSHYYNPYKKLKMRRADASISVIETEDTLNSDPALDRSDRGYLLLGRVIHYIQDAATPPHVVPVNHWLNDGFERYSATIEPDQDCAWVSTDNDPHATPLSIFQETAIETYQRVMRGSLSYQNGAETAQGSWWELFWTPGQGSEFGKYGVFGNRFGMSGFSIQGQVITVDPKVYDRFKQDQLRLAVDGTRKAFLWFERLAR